MRAISGKVKQEGGDFYDVGLYDEQLRRFWHFLAILAERNFKHGYFSLNNRGALEIYQQEIAFY